MHTSTTCTRVEIRAEASSSEAVQGPYPQTDAQYIHVFDCGVPLASHRRPQRHTAMTLADLPGDVLPKPLKISVSKSLTRSSYVVSSTPILLVRGLETSVAQLSEM